MKKLNVAVVGLGIGATHLKTYTQLAQLFNVAAICDLDQSRLAAAAAEFSVPFATADLQVLLSDDAIDLVDICTPPNSHLALIERALAAGKHVICEKPLVGSLAQADAVAAALARAPGTLFPIFQCRFGNGLQRLKHLQARGFGQHALLATVETHWRREADYYAVQWRGKWATEMGGVCLTQACHAHDILCYVLGPVQRVHAHLATRANDIEGEDCAAISLQMADGSVAVLSATLGAAKETSRMRFIFSDMTVEGASHDQYSPGKEPWCFMGKTPAIDAAIQAALSAFTPGPEGFEAQFAAIHAAIRAGTKAPVTVADARASLELVTAIYHSGETGEAVTLPIAKGHPKYASWKPAAGGFAKAVVHG